MADIGEGADTRRLLNAITPWQKRAHGDEGLAEATCQFTLALAGESRSSVLWKEWATTAGAPRVPLIMAGTAAPAVQQQTVITMVTKQRYALATKRELFVMLRFVHRDRIDGWLAHKRVALLDEYLDAVTGHGLETYYHQTLQAVLGNPALVTANNYITPVSRWSL